MAQAASAFLGKLQQNVEAAAEADFAALMSNEFFTVRSKKLLQLVAASCRCCCYVFVLYIYIVLHWQLLLLLLWLPWLLLLLLSSIHARLFLGWPFGCCPAQPSEP